jgi:uncharacterized protein (DUF1330 family)
LERNGYFWKKRRGHHRAEPPVLMLKNATSRGPSKRVGAKRQKNMVYAIAQLRITDRAAYNRYQARFMDVMRKFKGRLLAADEAPRIIEGAWDREKVVLLEFPDEPAFREWAESPEYLEIAKDRKAGSEALVLLVKGIAGR